LKRVLSKLLLLVQNIRGALAVSDAKICSCSYEEGTLTTRGNISRGDIQAIRRVIENRLATISTASPARMTTEMMMIASCLRRHG
jgi:hypothetical protein